MVRGSFLSKYFLQNPYSNSTKNEFVRSFFGRIRGYQKVLSKLSDLYHQSSNFLHYWLCLHQRWDWTSWRIEVAIVLLARCDCAIAFCLFAAKISTMLIYYMRLYFKVITIFVICNIILLKIKEHYFCSLVQKKSVMDFLRIFNIGRLLLTFTLELLHTCAWGSGPVDELIWSLHWCNI